MKIIDIANKIDKSPKNESDINFSELGYIFKLNLNCFWAESERLKCYWVVFWMCTDTEVGYKLYFLDDKPVAFSHQMYRTADENIRFFNNECSNAVKEHLLELMKDEEDVLNIEYCDINEDVGDDILIRYNGQVMDWSKATLNSEPIKFVERVGYRERYGADDEVKIIHNEEYKIVKTQELRFKFNLKEEN